MAEAKKNILTPDGLKALEDELQESIVTNSNSLIYQYMDEELQIDSK